ncbi:side tail fiber protein [Salmonella enterica subsp. arizonae]|uniref:Side tail fiber protein n=1 Tax=Salmonella enterica subsp. arizonae TaxID=59203 RepID=A0A379S769_SALER|nr:side tail fiber protein [Salmonella enterica subsp. arizonae]
MLKSALDISVDVTKITSPGIYPIIQGNINVPDASAGLLTVSLTPSKPQITFQKENSSVVYSFVNGNWVKPTATDVDALAKSQNGGDIPDIDLFVRNIGAARAFNGGINIGGDSGSWTTAEFITWLESQGAFNHPYWMCKGSWAYASNKIITDTGCGSICLAGRCGGGSGDWRCDYHSGDNTHHNLRWWCTQRSVHLYQSRRWICSGMATRF